MNMIKRIISATISTSIIGSCMIAFPTEAKVITPEIVKTETWTTSYYIDDDVNTLYPYIDCRADIYNDGTLSVSFWNNHEWDGFATVRHNIILVNTAPVSVGGENLPITVSESGGVVYRNRNKLSNYPKTLYGNFGEYTTIADVSYYPDGYRYSLSMNDGDFYTNSVNWTTYTENAYIYIPMLYAERALPNLKVGENYCNTYTFTPMIDPTGTYNFRILGHDITITPEILSDNVVSTPQTTIEDELRAELSDANSRYDTLMAEYETLKSQMANLEAECGELRHATETAREMIRERDANIETLTAESEQLNAIKKMYEDRMAKLSLAAEVIVDRSDRIERCDINGDGSIDSVDATLVLRAYALLSTGENIGRISDVVNWEYIQKFNEDLERDNGQ